MFFGKIRSIVFTLLFTMAIAVVTPTLVFAESSLTQTSEEALTSGAILKKYVWSSSRNNAPVNVNVNVIQVDLKNPLVKMDVMTGTNNQFTKNNTVRNMTNETGAVAGTNGDFFNTQAEGVPIGPQISNGQVMATAPDLKGFYSFALDKNNSPIVDAFAFRGEITAANGAKFPLGGINKTYYWFEDPARNGVESTIDAMFMYTNAWGQWDRSNDGKTVPTEVLVQNGIIKQIAVNSVIKIVAPKDGYILRAAGKAADFVAQNFKEGDPVTYSAKMFSQDSSKNYDVDSFKMMIGGGTLMVDEGKPAQFTRDFEGVGGNRSRTGVGYSKDQRFAYIITADNSGDSKGLSMTEFQKVMIQAGIWNGLNLDGGGSTQMAARPLGEFQTKVVNQTEYGSERKVVNGVGVFSTAPKGEVAGFVVSGPSQVLIGEQVGFQLKAYDQYYNPVNVKDLNQTWTSSNPIGQFQGNVFIPTQTGTTTLTVASGQGSQSINIEVIGRNQINDMKIASNGLVLMEGGTYDLPVVVTTKNGQTKQVSPQAVQWDLKGIDGEIKDGKLTVKSLAGSKMAQITARLDGYSTMLSVPLGDIRKWFNGDNIAFPLSGRGYPNEVAAGMNIAKETSGNNKLELSYDFTKGSGTKAAYVDFNGAYGMRIDGEPSYMNLKVEGDESKNWLRAEFMDANFQTFKVDLDKNVIWKGWKLLSVNLSDYNMKYPIALKDIYIVNAEQGQDERALTGKVAFDDISFSYKGAMPGAGYNKVSLTINKPVVSVNGNPLTLEQAPFIDRGNTLIPLRFVVEALGGKVDWNQDERKVTILRDDKLIELWNDQTDLIVNGHRITAEVPPRLANNLTMVPLRVISENLGWKVGWDQATYTVTLQ